VSVVEVEDLVGRGGIGAIGIHGQGAAFRASLDIGDKHARPSTRGEINAEWGRSMSVRCVMDEVTTTGRQKEAS
jgi:hypothetical protein